MQAVPFSPDADAGFFGSIPDVRAVYLLSTGEQGEPHLGRTAHLRARLQRLLAPSADRNVVSLRSIVREIHFQPVGSDFEADWELYHLARRYFPDRYRRWMRLRIPAMLRLNLANPYPRAHVVRGIGRPPSLYLGPFPSRARAELLASRVLDLFKIRRCVDDLHPDPAFPGCIYSEMKMCLAPCFRGCSDAEYAAETARVEAFLRTRGESLRYELESQRDRASQTLEFEQAALAHARLEKLRPLLRELPAIVREISGARGVLIQPAPGGSPANPQVHLFLADKAALTGPFLLRLVTPQIGASLEAWVGEQLQALFAPTRSQDRRTRNDHLALLARWSYRSRRQGELILWNREDPIPQRQITRASGRILRGERELPAREAAE